MTRTREENANDLRNEERLAEAEKVLLMVPEMVPPKPMDQYEFNSRCGLIERPYDVMMEGFGSYPGGMEILHYVAMQMIEHRNEVDVDPVLSAMMRERFPHVAPDTVVVESEADQNVVKVGVMRADRDEGYIFSTFTVEEVNEFTKKLQTETEKSPGMET